MEMTVLRSLAILNNRPFTLWAMYSATHGTAAPMIAVRDAIAQAIAVVGISPGAARTSTSETDSSNSNGYLPFARTGGATLG